MRQHRWGFSVLAKSSNSTLHLIVPTGTQIVLRTDVFVHALQAEYALLLPGPIEQSAIDVAQRANDLSKNANFAILHTLACVDAEAGKTSQARDLLLKAMDSLHLEEPNSEVWFGFALIAEQYGVLDAAEQMYSRVEKPKVDYPGTSYVIAQQHLTMLRGSANNSAKAVGQ